MSWDCNNISKQLFKLIFIYQKKDKDAYMHLWKNIKLFSSFSFEKYINKTLNSKFDIFIWFKMEYVWNIIHFTLYKRKQVVLLANGLVSNFGNQGSNPTIEI
jgi:hypothetical protein